MHEFTEKENAMLDAIAGGHPPVEADHVEAGGQAYQELQEQLTDLEAKLAAATQKNEALQEDLAEKQTALQNANAMAKRYLSNARDLQMHLKREKDGRDEDRKRFDGELDRIRKYVSKPIRWPLTIAVGFGVLSLLMGVCIDHGLMTCVLGDPLAAGLLAVCALFIGVVVERCRLR